MMHSESYHFAGIHMMYWIIWLIIVVFILAIPKKTPKRSAKKETPLNLLKKKFEAGEIDLKEYREKKNLISS